MASPNPSAGLTVTHSIVPPGLVLVLWLGSPAFRFAACRAKYNRRSAALNRRKLRHNMGSAALTTGAVPLRRKNDRTLGGSRHGGQAETRPYGSKRQCEIRVGCETAMRELSWWGKRVLALTSEWGAEPGPWGWVSRRGRRGRRLGLGLARRRRLAARCRVCLPGPVLRRRAFRAALRSENPRRACRAWRLA